MSVATPKHQANDPINFDIIMVCRKKQSGTAQPHIMEGLTISEALSRAETQLDRLRNSGWKLSRNDIGVVVMAQVVAQISRQPGEQATERMFEEARGSISQAIDRLHSWFL